LLSLAVEVVNRELERENQNLVTTLESNLSSTTVEEETNAGSPFEKFVSTKLKEAQQTDQIRMINEDEMHLYLNDDSCPVEKDPLEYWRGKNFPKLQKVCTVFFS
jgi:hypothetical protein